MGNAQTPTSKRSGRGSAVSAAAHTKPCRCGAYDFPHRRAEYCDFWRDYKAPFAVPVRSGEAADEAAYQQATWDLDRARAIR